MKLCNCVQSVYFKLVSLGETLAWPVLQLIMRLYIANIFWKSGKAKIGDMEGTIDLFVEEYTVPLLPPELAAYMATGGELLLPILLVFGVFGRIGAAGLLIMTAVIELSYFHNEDHYFWAMILGVLLLKGMGTLSIDWFASKKIKKA